MEPYEAQVLPKPVETRRRAFPLIWQALVLCGVFIVFQLGLGILFSIAAYAISAILGVPVPPAFLAGLTAVANVAAFVAVLIAAWLWSGHSLPTLVPLRRFRPGLLIPMTVTVIGAHFVLSEVDNLVRYVLPIPDFLTQMFGELLGSAWVSFLVLVVVAPLTEEPFFRGIVLGGFMRNYRPVTAAVVSSLLFALIHLNPWQFFGALTLGLLFAWLLMRTGSLWPCLYGHALANGMSFIGAVIPIPIAGYNVYTEGALFQPLWLDLSGLVLTLVGLLWLKAMFAAEHEP